MPSVPWLCRFNRHSHAYGETAMVAAVTAPVIVVGPILGGKGALVRHLTCSDTIWY